MHDLKMTDKVVTEFRGLEKNGPRNSAMALSVIFQSVKFQSPGFLATLSVVFRSCSVSAPSPVRAEQGQ